MSKCAVEASVDNILYKLKAAEYESDAHSAIIKYIKDPSLTEELPFHKWHKKLYDLLFDHVMEIGSKYAGGVFIIDPKEIIDSFITYLGIRRGGLSVGALFKGTHSMQAAYNIAKKGIELKNKRIHSATKTLMPEDYISFRLDDTGNVAKITKSASSLSDRIKQRSLEFREKFLEINKGLYNWMEELTRGGHISLNDLLINPIDIELKGKIGVGKRFRSPSRKAKLVGVIYDKLGNIDEYVVEENGKKFGIDDENEFDFDKDITLSEEIITRAVAGIKSFIDDLGHGQVRKIIPMKSDKISDYDRKRISWQLRASVEKGKMDKRSPYIHTKIIGDTEYEYVMIKQGEDDIGEKYHAYIIRHIDINRKGEKGYSGVYYFNAQEGYKRDITTLQEQADITSLIDKDGNLAFKEGFYKASDQELFGNKLNKNMKVIKGSVDKAFVDFNYMEKQPHEKLMSEDIPIDDENYSIWKALHQKRVLNNELWEIAQKSSIETNATVEEWFSKAHQQTIKQLMKENNKDFLTAEIESVDKIFGDLKKLGIENKLWYNSEQNELHSLALSMSKKNENYFPVKFWKKVSDGFIDSAIDEIDSKIKMAKSSNELEALEKAKRNLEISREQNSGNRAILEKLAITFKHRKPSTNDMFRRKDDEVETEYIDSVFSALEKNKLLADTVTALYKITSLNRNSSVPVEQIKYMINSVKSSMNDPSVEAEIFGFDVSSATIAKYFNQFSGTEKYTAEDAERIFKRMKAWMSWSLLGAPAAFTNRFQRYNDVIIAGKKTLNKAHKAAHGQDRDKWRYIADYGGALNMIAALNDAIMTSTSDLKWNDALFYNNPIAVLSPFIPSQWPNFTNMKDYFSMLSMKRDSFIEKGHHAADKVIDHMIEKRIQKSRSLKEKTDLEYLKDLKKELRGAYYDLVTTPEEENNRKILKQRYKALVGDVTETMEKKFVSWKLSWFFNNDASDVLKALTFTGQEENNRLETYIAALMVADEFGDLGSDTSEDKITGIKKRFLSPKAVQIGRLAILSTQFNMAQVNQGEGFRGLGQVFLQYRDYTVKQMRFSRNVRKAWLAGSENRIDAATRLSKALLDVITKENSPNTKIDYEALAMARLFYTRGLATLTASAIASFPMFNFTIKRIIGEAPIRAMRGFESPIFSIFGRIAFRWLFWALIGDDDDEDKIRDKSVRTAEDILRLAVPVAPAILATYFLRAGNELID